MRSFYLLLYSLSYNFYLFKNQFFSFELYFLCSFDMFQLFRLNILSYFISQAYRSLSLKSIWFIIIRLFCIYSCTLTTLSLENFSNISSTSPMFALSLSFILSRSSGSIWARRIRIATVLSVYSFKQLDMICYFRKSRDNTFNAALPNSKYVSRCKYD